MALDTETLYNRLGRQYETVYSNNAGLQEVIAHILSVLPPNGHVLDVGNGTGKPVADSVSRAGHKIDGIDVSQEMVNITSAGGHFEKVDMMQFKPKRQYDAVYAMFSLFQQSHKQTYSLMFRFSEWLKKGGMRILGTIPSSSLIDDESLYDASGKVVRHAEILFMGKFYGTLYTKDGWRELFAGFEVQFEKTFTFHATPPYCEIEDQYFVVGRKVVDHALMGPCWILLRGIRKC